MSDLHPPCCVRASQPSARQPPADTLILAVGNLLRGDDGVGSVIVERLTRSARLPSSVRCVDGGTGGVNIAGFMEGYRRVIVVDSAEIGGAPGEWRRFTREDLMPAPEDSVPTHSLGLEEALCLGEALHLLPPEISIYGVQPQVIGWQDGLSEAVQRALPALCEAIIREVGAERTSDGQDTGG